jgi:hypothetical protein
MGEYVVIEPGHVRIDAVGWVARRTGDEYVKLTDLLQGCVHARRGSSSTGRIRRGDREHGNP